MKTAAVCCTLSLLIVLLTVVEGRPGQSRWRREVTANTTSSNTDTTTETINGPANNGTCGSNCLRCHVSGTGTDGLDTTVCDECSVSFALDSENKCQYCGSVLCLKCNISKDSEGKVITKHLLCVEKAHLVNDVCEGCPDYCDTCTVTANADGTLTKTCSKCIVGYGFQGGSTCSRCPTNCLNCEKEKDKCDTQGCIDGYARVDSSGLCEACGKYCYKCQTSAGPGKCDSGSCYTNVTELYVNVPLLYPVIYVSSTQSCEKCSEFCTSCTTAAQCDVCLEGYYVNDQKTCTRCISNCQSCTSGTDCSKCYAGYVKRTSTSGTVSCEACPRKCTQCADTQHPVKTTELLCEVCSARNQLTTVNTCDKCPLNCLQCTWDGTCTSCEAGYVIYNGQCLQCPQYCTACTVSSTGVSSCITGKCTSTDSGQGRVVYNGQCELCPDYCSACTVTSTGTKECLYSSCQSNSAWVPGQKICKQCPSNCGGWCAISPITGDTFCEECKVGYVRNAAGTCEACPANCDRCFWDGTTALCYLSGCRSGSYQKLMSAAKLTNSQLSTLCSANSDQNCMIASPVPYFDSDVGLCEMCASGYVNATDMCRTCGTTCKTCEADGTSAVCKACISNSVLIPDANGGIQQCKACTSVTSACQTCTEQACTACSAGYILHSEAQCIACSDVADAVCSISSNILRTTTCPSGYTETNDGCEKCPDGCSVCSYNTGTGKTTCSTCYDGYFHGSDGTCTACLATANCRTCTTAVDHCSQCKDKYFDQSGECKPCMSNCDACSSTTTCNSCSKGTSYNKDDQNNYSCLRCTVSNCVSCATSSSTAVASQCTTCDDGYTVNGGLCLKCPDGCTKCTAQGGQAICDYGQCQMGYVMVAKTGDTIQCESCGTGCATCHVDSSNNKVCDACLIDDVAGTSYYLSNGACQKVSNCRFVKSSTECDDDGCAVGKVRKGTHPTATCEACPAGCDKCYYEDTAQTVVKCYTGKCSTGFAYYDGSCYACPASCSTCNRNSSTTFCTACNEGYAVNASDTGCTQCGTGCAACNNADNIDFSCTRCSAQYVIDLTTSTCSACTDNCQICSTADLCSTGGCSSKFGRIEYSSTNVTCQACPSNCLKCDGDTSICASGQCEEGYFRDSDQLCHQCAGNCTTCSAENSCNVAGCKVYFGRVTLNDGNITCESCPANCRRCDGDSSICEQDQCDVGYVRGSNNLCHKIDCGSSGAVLKSDGSCQNPISNCMVGVITGSSCPQGACQLGTIWNNGQCSACPTNCKNCKIHYDGTTVCHNNGCKRGFGVKPDGTCMACPTQCHECVYSGTKMVCTVCNERRFGLVEADTCLRCPSGCTACTELNQVLQCTMCSEGYVLNPSTNLCVRCVSNCKVCVFTETTLSTQCTMCMSKYKLSTDGSCNGCPEGCMKCDQTTDSTSCDPLYCQTGYVQGPTGVCHQCPSECPDRCKYNETSTTGVNVACFPTNEFYWDGNTLKRCIDSGDGSCVQCRDSINCLQTGCQDGYTWNQFKCERKHSEIGTGNAFCVGYVCPECLTGYYMTTLDADANQRTCKACPVDKNCVNCQLVGTDVKCISCPDNYYLYDTTGTCIECFPSPCSQCDSTKASDAKVCSACIAGYFLNSTTHACNACNTTCATCTDSSKCVTCKTGYLLDSTTKYCFKCPDVNAYNCELKNGYDSLILTNGCVSGYAVSTDKKSCLKCPDYCITCDSNLTCSACNTGYSLNSDQCGRCPLNCQSCTAKLDSDKRLKLSCDVCDYGYALHSDGLCYVCPANCVECTASDSGTATPKVSCTKCQSNLYGIKDGLCETCDKLTIDNCYTCEPVPMSDNVTSSLTKYTCHSCKGNNVISLDNQTCLSCDSVSCGSGGVCGAHSLCPTCQNSFANNRNRNCTVKCYNCEKGQSCKHIDDKWQDKSGIPTVECDGPCFFYTQYPLNAKKDSRVSWYGCADPDFTVLNYEATYNDKMKALECKGKEGQPETCVYSCAYDGCNPGDTASAVVPLISLLIMALFSSMIIQQN
ncbi:hypothetical protein LSH36_15g03064 [Paralvinella palmiformis]|uniref:EGF-like domain-containing protein n=1 Tax=Paralvinella palmiformis TaxID=53620 RepID=A0AAD9NFS0_9ANNE|nr:hypothetical protein LSH36_15g03064 [Paralvinella palmiformis]